MRKFMLKQLISAALTLEDMVYEDKFDPEEVKNLI